jgi:cytochrome c oxidase assembly protein subunit 11
MTAMANRNNWVGLIVLVLPLFMLGAAYAAVPLYDLFCRVTGYGGRPMIAEKAPDRILARAVTVRFDANVDPSLPWRFETLQSKISLKLGETAQVAFRATNLSDKPVTGTALYNVTPDITGPFFNKLQCFCFSDQTLAPGQTMDFPITLFIDPAMVDDISARDVHEITLSYTFYEAREAKDKSAASSRVAQGRATR